MPTPSAADLDRRITILRRSVIENDDGNPRGDFAPAWICWAQFKPIGLRVRAELAIAGMAEDQVDGAFTIRDCAEARAITAADRLVDGPLSDTQLAEGREYSITSVAPADRSGFRVISVTRGMGH